MAQIVQEYIILINPRIVMIIYGTFFPHRKNVL